MVTEFDVLRKHPGGVLARVAMITASISLSLAGFLPAMAAENPLLITYGNKAPIREGDPDFLQLVRFSLPVSYAGKLHVRVFDADTGGREDEEFLRYDTTMRYALYAASADISDGLTRDENGFLAEQAAGRLLGETTISKDDSRDGRWATLFSVDAGSGQVVAGRREFFLLVEGTDGDDGNVFDVFISLDADENRRPEDLRLYSLIPTVRVPDRTRLTELRLTTPADISELIIGNFDTNRGDIVFETRFRTLTLDSTRQGEWASTKISLQDAEKDSPAAVTFGGGQEIPNDITFYVVDPSGNPLAIELPPRSIRPNKRPIIALSQEQLSCGSMRFDARLSRDPDGTDLTYNWDFGGPENLTGALIDRSFEPGTYQGRLEIFDGSNVVGNGRSQDFQILVKAPPVASFNIPEKIPLGTQLVLDAYASRSSAPPAGLSLERYEWQLGNGEVVAGNASDAATVKHTYSAAGEYAVRLTVTDSGDGPCNRSEIVRRVIVDAPPTAEIAHEDTLVAGQAAEFDATGSADPDGAIIHYEWDFGDGLTASSPRVSHTYHKPGEYRVTMLAADDSGFRENKTIARKLVRVMEATNETPVASAGGDKEAVVGEPVNFDASRSGDDDGEILDYFWDFGDGSSGRQISMSHTYWKPGRYEVALTVRDNSGQKNDRGKDTVVVNVSAASNAAPSVIVKSMNAATRFLPVTFDASKSTDPDGSIIEYAWDFGDGTSATGAVVTHSYSEPGSYKVNLVITDDFQPDAGRSEASLDVTVGFEENRPPVAVLGPDLEAITREIVSFDASASSDPNGTIMSYDWDFGDGHRSTGVAPRHAYQFPGEYIVSLTVSDSHATSVGATADTLKITVRDPENRPPQAFAGNDLSVEAGEIIQFDGTDSSDPDGNITAYEWDFGTGETSRMAKPKYAFHDQGIYKVRLKVTDDNHRDTKTDEIELTVTVRAAGEGASTDE